MKIHSRIFALVLILALGLFGIAQAGSVVCFEACLERKPVVTMDCCEDEGSMVHMAMNGPTNQQDHETEPCCEPELCPDMYYQPDNFVFNSQDNTDGVVLSPPPVLGHALTLDTLPTEPLKPDPLGLRVSLYTLHCSYLN